MRQPHNPLLTEMHCLSSIAKQSREHLAWIFARNFTYLSVGEGSTLGLKLDRAICDFCASFLSNNRESPRPGQLMIWRKVTSF